MLLEVDLSYKKLYTLHFVRSDVVWSIVSTLLFFKEVNESQSMGNERATSILVGLA